MTIDRGVPYKWTPPKGPFKIAPPKTFDVTVSEWDTLAKQHNEAAQRSQADILSLEQEYESLAKSTEGKPSGLMQYIGFGQYPVVPSLYEGTGEVERAKLQMGRLRSQIESVELEIESADFYTRLYNQVPIVINSLLSGTELVVGELPFKRTTVTADPDSILTALKPPPNMSPAELEEVKGVITGIIEALSPDSVVEPLPEMASEAEAPFLPELEAPVPYTAVPVTINKLTMDSILKTLKTPIAPPSVMSEDEWAEFLVESGQISDKADIKSIEFLQNTADNLVLEWQERNNMLESYRAGIAEMPDFKFIDLMKEAVIQPGLALAEIAGMYFEHVSSPLTGSYYKDYQLVSQGIPMIAGIAGGAYVGATAGAVLGPLGAVAGGIIGGIIGSGIGATTGAMLKPLLKKLGLPDITLFTINDLEAEYQRLRKTGSEAEALARAWNEWDAPGEGAAEWILKYILMEGLTDPLTYVGWGLITRITKPLGSFGRIVGKLEGGIAQVMELPFDLIKMPLRAKWNPRMVRALHLPERFVGQYFVPRTPGQLATIAMDKAGQYVDKALTTRYGKALYQLTMKEWNDGVDYIIKHTMRNPQLDNTITRAGKELLKHTPITKDEVLIWSERLGTSLTPDQVTRQTVESVDRLFEDFFSNIKLNKRLIVSDEAADELVRILYGTLDQGNSKVASSLIKARAERILGSAFSFNTSKTPFKAVRGLMRRNYRIHILTDKSEVALARTEMGRISTLLFDVPDVIQRTWINGIDRWIVKPFAESYLTFAMYGPMNVIEDIMRSTLGGVTPSRKSPEAFARKWAGTSYDTGLMRDAVSETMGYLSSRPEGELNNWILQLGGLAKGFGDKTYNILVNRPGQIGSSIRRNFVDGRASQILKEIGGDLYNRLANVGPRDLPNVSGRLSKEVQQAATQLKVQGLPDAIRALKNDFTRANIYRREVDNILKQHPDLPRPVRDFVMRQQDDNLIFREAGDSINQTMREADSIMLDDFITSPERAAYQYEQLVDELVQLEVTNPQEMAQLIQSLNTMSSMYGATPQQIMGRAVERTRGLPFADRRLSMDKTMDSITLFRDKAGASMDRLVEKIRVDMAAGLFDANPAYGLKAESLFNLQTAKRLRASELGEGVNAYRHELFAQSTPADLGTESFWDNYSREISSRWHDFNVEMARFDGQIKSSIDQLDIAGGLPARQRPPLRVIDRALAPNDVAQLIGARGDDISRGLLDVMTAQNDRDMFVEFVMAQVKPDDAGFTRESVGEVFDRITASLGVPEGQMNWLTGKRKELGVVRQELHDLHNSKILPDEEIANIGRYLDETADAVEEVTSTLGMPQQDVGLGERVASSQDVADLEAEVQRLVKGGKSEADARSIVIGKSPVETMYDPKVVDEIRGEVTEAARQVRIPDDIAGPGDSIYLSDAMDNWFANSENDALQAIGKTASQSPEYLAKIHGILNEQYPSGYIRIYRGTGAAKGAALEREFTNITSSKRTAIGFEDTWTTSKEGIFGTEQTFGRPDTPTIDNILVKVDDIVSIGAVAESELIIPASILKNRINNPLKPPTAIRTEYTAYNELRQQAMDEAHKWYYKEFTDYSNANAFDALIKSIYPFWTYESQRWFWLPRSFVRHPGTFTSYERWQDNTDYGYIHVPGTSVDINPFRGTVYGTLTTRLSKRDYPEYYDSLGSSKGLVEFSDFLSRYGFYPGAQFGIPMALFMGQEMQLGEVLPAIVKTPLSVLIGMFPDNENVKWISDHVFSDRFRDYMTTVGVNNAGGEGSLIFSKMKEGKALTPEEEQQWNDARREVGFYSALFEQGGLFRYRTDEQHELYAKSAEVIEEMYGYTPDQQKWLRQHGYQIFDLVGGISPTEQAVLQQLDLWGKSAVRPLLPGKQQEILNKIELDWNSVEVFGDTIQAGRLRLQNEFLSGQRGSGDYNSELIQLFDSQRTYIDGKVDENPLMLLENRKDYYKEYGIVTPVLHPMKELLNLYYSIELKEVTDPSTGEIVRDWDNFWAQRQAIEDSIPDDLKSEWDEFLSKNTTRIEEVRREVYGNYFRTYNKVWEEILSTYPEEEQAIINEYLYLERTKQQLDRQEEIKAMLSTKTGLTIISGFRSEVSGSKKALRYANPHLEAWLYYWDKSNTIPTGEALDIFNSIMIQTGRRR